MRRLVCLLGAALLLSACGDENAVRLGPQHWDDTRFVVETRPSPVRRGMTEFIVIATRGSARPGVGYVISLRTRPEESWHQAIQDGFTGVYRRAIWVEDPQHDSLQVLVRKSAKKIDEGARETVLSFPLQPSAALP